MAGAALLVSVLSVILSASSARNTVAVDVYYESLCPDSRSFFFKQLSPVYESLKSNIELGFIPYGNANVVHREDKGTYFKCQHGPDECYGNIMQTCFDSIVNDTLTSLKFINCSFRYKTQQNILQQCIESESLRNEVSICGNGPQGFDLQLEMARKTTALNPEQTFIPWITINKEGSEKVNRKANQNLLDLICEYLDPAPPACRAHHTQLRELYRRLVGL